MKVLVRSRSRGISVGYRRRRERIVCDIGYIKFSFQSKKKTGKDENHTCVYESIFVLPFFCSFCFCSVSTPLRHAMRYGRPRRRRLVRDCRSRVRAALANPRDDGVGKP